MEYDYLTGWGDSEMLSPSERADLTRINRTAASPPHPKLIESRKETFSTFRDEEWPFVIQYIRGKQPATPVIDELYATWKDLVGLLPRGQKAVQEAAKRLQQATTILRNQALQESRRPRGMAMLALVPSSRFFDFKNGDKVYDRLLCATSLQHPIDKWNKHFARHECINQIRDAMRGAPSAIENKPNYRIAVEIDRAHDWSECNHDTCWGKLLPQSTRKVAHQLLCNSKFLLPSEVCVK